MAVQAGDQHEQGGRRQQSLDSEMQMEQNSLFQPNVRTAMVVLGTVADLGRCHETR